MTDAHTFSQDRTALPDPDRDPQFYEGVRTSRVVAWIVDTALVAAISVVLIAAVGVGTLGFGFLFAPMVGLLTAFAYRYLSIAARSRTPGMALMGIEFRNLAGERFDRVEAFVHTAVYTVVFASVAGQFLTCLSALLTPRGQTIADIVTGATAINRPL